jgi:hypothetical protein
MDATPSLVAFKCRSLVLPFLFRLPRVAEIPSNGSREHQPKARIPKNRGGSNAFKRKILSMCSFVFNVDVSPPKPLRTPTLEEYQLPDLSPGECLTE